MRTVRNCQSWVFFFVFHVGYSWRVATNLENMEKSGNLKVVRENSVNLKVVRENSGKCVLACGMLLQVVR